MREIWLFRAPRCACTRFLSEDEITRFLDACRQSRNRLLAPLVTLALTTGARYSELATLTWEQLALAADFGLSPVMRLAYTKRTDAPAALTALAPDPASRVGRVFRLKGSIRTAFDHALKRAGIHGRVVVDDQGRLAAIGPGDPRAQHTGADRALQPPRSDAHPGRPRAPSGPGRTDEKRARHGTRCGTISPFRCLNTRRYSHGQEILSF